MTKNTPLLITVHIGQQQLFPPFQPLWIASSKHGVARFFFGIDRETFTSTVQKRFPHAEIILSHAPHPALHQIGEYLRGERRTFYIPLDLSASTPFQRQVYQAVMAIPYGQTRTYGQVAALIGSPNAARAVGAANGANPLPILIPCHRLVGADGRLRGYGGVGGTTTKQWLLDLEKRTVS